MLPWVVYIALTREDTYESFLLPSHLDKNRRTVNKIQLCCQSEEKSTRNKIIGFKIADCYTQLNERHSWITVLCWTVYRLIILFKLCSIIIFNPHLWEEFLLHLDINSVMCLHNTMLFRLTSLSTYELKNTDSSFHF